MADYRIQLKDKEGNRQFPVTTTQSIVDSEGRSLEEILANLGDGSGSIDPEMSDTSENVVQNKVVKKYIDDAIANVGEGCITFYKGNWTIEERLTVEQKAHNASMFQLYKTSPYAIGVFVDRSEELSLANGLSGRALKVSIPAQAQYLPIETGTEAIMLKEDLFNNDEIAMVILNDGSVYGANELE